MPQPAPGLELGAAVGAALGTGRVEIAEWHRDAVEYDAFLAHREVNRVHGRARVDGRLVPFAFIEKVTGGPRDASPYLYANGTREHHAYASGLLDELAPVLRAPRLLGSQLSEDGRITLWLEEVVHEGARPLDGESLVIAARDLGVLGGSRLGRVPADPWLFTGWIDRHAQPEAMAAGLAVLSTRAPAVIGRLGWRLAAGRELLRAQARVRGMLDALPQTLCHHDAVGANVFVSAGCTALIDWESVGPGALGADLASLLCASVRRGDLMAQVMLESFEAAVAAYIEGMRQESRVAESEIRLGIDASIALRWKLFADIAEGLEQGRPARRGSLPDEDPETACDELVALAGLVAQASARALAA